MAPDEFKNLGFKDEVGAAKAKVKADSSESADKR